MPHPLDIELLDYAEGICDNEWAQEIRAHIARCRWCRLGWMRIVHSLEDNR